MRLTGLEHADDVSAINNSMIDIGTLERARCKTPAALCGTPLTAHLT